MNDGYPWWAPILSGLAAWASTNATHWLRHRRGMTKRRQQTATDAPSPLESASESPSTTFEWRRVKVARPPEAIKHSAAKGRSFRQLPRRNPRTPLTITVKLRGGPEAWVEVHARGALIRLPGWVQVCDLVDIVNSIYGP